MNKKPQSWSQEQIDMMLPRIRKGTLVAERAKLEEGKYYIATDRIKKGSVEICNLRGPDRSNEPIDESVEFVEVRLAESLHHLPIITNARIDHLYELVILEHGTNAEHPLAPSQLINSTRNNEIGTEVRFVVVDGFAHIKPERRTRSYTESQNDRLKSAISSAMKEIGADAPCYNDLVHALKVLSIDDQPSD